MWEVLTRNGLGLILLLDNTRKAPLNDKAFFLNAFKDYIADTAVAIGITQTDIVPPTKDGSLPQKASGTGYKRCYF